MLHSTKIRRKANPGFISSWMLIRIQDHITMYELICNRRYMSPRMVGGTSPGLPPELPARLDAEVNRGSKSHKDGGILHACHMSHRQLYQWLALLPSFTLHSTAHHKSANHRTQSRKVSAALRAWQRACRFVGTSLRVYVKLATLFSVEEDLRHEKLPSLWQFRKEMKAAANGVSDATFAPCLELPPGLPAVRPTRIWPDNQPRSWVRPGNPIATR